MYYPLSVFLIRVKIDVIYFGYRSYRKARILAQPKYYYVLYLECRYWTQFLFFIIFFLWGGGRDHPQHLFRF